MLIVQEKLQLQTKYHVQRPFLGSWRRWKPPTDRQHTWGKRRGLIFMSLIMKATFQVLVSHFSDISSKAECNFNCSPSTKAASTSPPPVVLELPVGGQIPSAPTAPWFLVYFNSLMKGLLKINFWPLWSGFLATFYILKFSSELQLRESTGD